MPDDVSALLTQQPLGPPSWRLQPHTTKASSSVFQSHPYTLRTRTRNRFRDEIFISSALSPCSPSLSRSPGCCCSPSLTASLESPCLFLPAMADSPSALSTSSTPSAASSSPLSDIERRNCPEPSSPSEEYPLLPLPLPLPLSTLLLLSLLDSLARGCTTPLPSSSFDPPLPVSPSPPSTCACCLHCCRCLLHPSGTTATMSCLAAALALLLACCRTSMAFSCRGTSRESRVKEDANRKASRAWQGLWGG